MVVIRELPRPEHYGQHDPWTCEACGVEQVLGNPKGERTLLEDRLEEIASEVRELHARRKELADGDDG